MTPRTASLRVAHQRKCAHGGQTAPESVKGCTCDPGGRSYYVQWRDRSGATRKSPRVKDRREAEKFLRAKQVEIDQGRIGTEPERNIEFPAWVDQYLAILEQRPGVKGETIRAYRKTLNVAKGAIGYAPVRRIRNAELRRFHARIAHTSEATQLKDLSQLAACLSAAVDEGYAGTDLRDRTRVFRKSLRLRAASGTPPFTDGELERLYAALADEEPVYLALVDVMVATGLRVGEAIALDWQDVDLSSGKLYVRHTYNWTDGLTSPKDRDQRTVYLTPEAQQVLGDWIKLAGVHEQGVMFPAPRSRNYVSATYLGAVVRDAIAAAGIPTLDAASGRPRKPLHSLRATFTRRALERGANPLWVQRVLGHSNLELTANIYGAWSEEAMLAEASRA
jgi:integrase